MNNRSFHKTSEPPATKEQIVETARRWLRTHPGLASHAASTLEFWGEPLVDDRGKPYKPDDRGNA
jgi:hypothetical protein